MGREIKKPWETKISSVTKKRPSEKKKRKQEMRRTKRNRDDEKWLQAIQLLETATRGKIMYPTFSITSTVAFNLISTTMAMTLLGGGLSSLPLRATFSYTTFRNVVRMPRLSLLKAPFHWKSS